MKFPFSIRSATPNDWQAIADFNILLALETENKDLDRPTVEAGVLALLSDPNRGLYFVACLDSRIIGQLMHTREWSDWRNGEIWWLQSVFVHPDFRNSGVFKALYRHVEQRALENPQIVGIRLYVEEHNFKAMKAYESLGLKDAGYKVMQRLIENQKSRE